MNKNKIINNIELLYNLTFKTKSYRKNFDLITKDEHIITEYEGNIGELRIGEKKPPEIIGEFGYSVWNIGNGRLLDVDFDTLIDKYSNDDTYECLKQVSNDNLFDVRDYNRVVFIHSLILKNDYKKRGISEEFIETIYREFYDDNTAILILAKPLQNNMNYEDFYLNLKTVDYFNISGDTQALKRIPASDYYSLRELYDRNDDEYNEYKIFAVADRCGFKRIGESYLFKFFPENTVERLLTKMDIYNEIRKKQEEEK